MNKLIAETPAGIFGTINPPSPIQGLVDKGGAGGISTVLSNGVVLFFRVGIIVFFIMVLWSAFEWITSGGDKEKVASARGRLTSSMVGLAIMGLAGLIARVIGDVVGISLPIV
jgi:hypothetical protein